MVEKDDDDQYDEDIDIEIMNECNFKYLDFLKVQVVLLILDIGEVGFVVELFDDFDGEGIKINDDDGNKFDWEE